MGTLVSNQSRPAQEARACMRQKKNKKITPHIILALEITYLPTNLPTYPPPYPENRLCLVSHRSIGPPNKLRRRCVKLLLSDAISRERKEKKREKRGKQRATVDVYLCGDFRVVSGRQGSQGPGKRENQHQGPGYSSVRQSTKTPPVAPRIGSVNRLQGVSG